MITTMNEIEQRFDAIKDHKPKASKKLNELGECLWYLNPFKPSCSNIFPSNGSGTFHTRLGEHCFYRPTASYANT